MYIMLKKKKEKSTPLGVMTRASGPKSSPIYHIIYVSYMSSCSCKG